MVFIVWRPGQIFSRENKIIILAVLVVLPSCDHNYWETAGRSSLSVITRAGNEHSPSFTLTKEGPTRAFSSLKEPTSGFTVKNLFI